MRSAIPGPGSSARRSGFTRSAVVEIIVGVTLGVALCAVFAVGFWFGRKADTPPPVATQPPVAHDAAPAPVPTPEEPQPPRVSEAPRAQPTEPPATVAANPELEKPAPVGPVVALEPRDRPAAPEKPVVKAKAAPIEAERFALREPPRQEPEPFILPQDPWFALGAVSADEPVEDEPQVCAADRRLSTAVSWAKSPEEASEQALRDGKLVFLIHVSGNFENPGFT